MPSSASGQRTALRYVSESAFGVASGTTFKALRFTDTGLNLSKSAFQSNEIRSDRQKADLRHGMRSVGGDISVELGLTTFDDLIEAAVSGTWAPVTSGAVSLATTTGTNTITRTAGSFLTDGFLPGDEVTLSSFSTGGNNGAAKVLTVAADGLSMTVSRPLATEAAAAGKTVALVGKRVKAGTQLKTFQFERAFTDIGQFLLYKGCAVDSMKLSIKPEEIITAVFGILGKDMTQAAATNSTAVTAAAANSPFDAFNGVLQEGGTTIAYVTGLDIELSNGRQVKGVVGSTSPQEIFEGGSETSGTVSLFFQDAAMLNKFINETESSLDVRLNDPNGTDFMRIRMPRVKYTGGTLDNPKEGPVMLSLPYTALLDATAGTSLIVQRSNP